MKQYPKTYEDVFSSDPPKARTRLKLDKVSAGDLDLVEYESLFKTFLTRFYSEIFDGCVRFSWLRRKFSYHGTKTILPMHKNPPMLNMGFVKFMRRNVGKDFQLITRSKFFPKLELYFEDFFPGFQEGNPFENPDYYKFPYKNISLDYLLVVHELEDRLPLLEYADQQKMSYAVFVDYVINHVFSVNEEIGRDRYQLKQVSEDRNFPFFIRDSDKRLKAVRGKKRV